MCSMLILIGLFVQGSPKTITLEMPAAKLEILQNDQLQLMEDGSIIAIDQDWHAVYHWNAEGSLITTITVPKEAEKGVDSDPCECAKEIATCIYDVAREIYWVSDTASRRCYFYDKNGQPLGAGIDPEGNQSFRLRQFIKTRGRIFAVDTARVDVWRNPDAPLLTEISLHKNEEGKFVITRQGDHFCRITQEQRSMDYNLKLFWVVQDDYHHNLYVVDQLSPRIRHFVPNPRDENGRLESLDRQISFGLTRYVPPPNTWNTKMRTRKEFVKWWYSWSRINGFYPYGSGFVVGYDIPDKNLKKRCLLGLQKLKRNGKRDGKVDEIDGFLIGVKDDLAYILEGPKQGKDAFIVTARTL